MPDHGLPDLWRTAPALAGVHARLEPLSRDHADAMRAALVGDALAQLHFTNVPPAAGVADYIDKALDGHAAGECLPFAVFDAQDRLVGSTRFYELHQDVPRLSIGYTWYTPQAQRTGVNTETKLLLLAHAFEVLDCISVVFETSLLNLRSRAAIARLGAKQDGILRNHKRHVDGSPRDTVVFSIIDSEWQGVKRGLQDKLQQHGHMQ